MNRLNSKLFLFSRLKFKFASSSLKSNLNSKACITSSPCINCLITSTIFIGGAYYSHLIKICWQLWCEWYNFIILIFVYCKWWFNNVVLIGWFQWIFNFFKNLDTVLQSLILTNLTTIPWGFILLKFLRHYLTVFILIQLTLLKNWQYLVKYFSPIIPHNLSWWLYHLNLSIIISFRFSTELVNNKFNGIIIWIFLSVL